MCHSTWPTLGAISSAPIWLQRLFHRNVVITFMQLLVSISNRQVGRFQPLTTMQRRFVLWTRERRRVEKADPVFPGQPTPPRFGKLAPRKAGNLTRAP